MKIKYSGVLPAALVLLLMITGCSDMEEIHNEYLQGEKIYSGILDSLEVNSGYERLEIAGSTRFLWTAKEVIVEWDDNMEVFQIEENPGEEFKMIVNNLEERSYEFQVYTQDTDGNKSITQTVTGRSVGEIFKSNQQARRIVNIESLLDGTFINWAHKTESEHGIFTEIKYSNTDGGMTTDTIYPDEVSTKLINWEPLGELKINSFIKSGDRGIDTIPLSTVEDMLPPTPIIKLDKDLFTLLRMPSDNPGTFYGGDPVQYLFDGDGTWRGDSFGYHSGLNSIPHHFTIDLGVMTSIRKAKLDLRDPNNFTGNNPTEIEFWGRTDIEGAETSSSDAAEFEAKGWQLLYRGTVDGANNQSLEVEIEDESVIRYLRYRVIGSVGGGSAQLTEMTFWGEDIQSL